jgi:endoglucanase
MGISLTTGMAQERPAGLQDAACQIRIHSAVPAPRLMAVARGFNLTGWLDQDSPRRPDLATLQQLRTRGFSHIRLPVKAELLMAAYADPLSMQRHWQELDQAITVLNDLGYAVSIDVHPGEAFGKLHRTQPDHGFELLSSLWRLLAERYRSRPADRVFFELLNEPTVDAAIWDVQGRRLAAEIRKIAPEQTIVYGPGHYQSISTLVDLQPLPDPNVIYAVHFYQPMVFTHQGLDWSPDSPLHFLSDIPFPTDTDRADLLLESARLTEKGHLMAALLLQNEVRAPWTPKRIEAELARAGAWSIAQHRPVIMNEFGALSIKSNPADRARWITTVRRAAEQNCLGWAHWEYADSFGFVRREAGHDIPDQRIMDALLGSDRPREDDQGPSPGLTR